METELIPVGTEVRSYHFPGFDDTSYVEGEVVGHPVLEGCQRYQIKVRASFLDGKPDSRYLGLSVFPPAGPSLFKNVVGVVRLEN